MAVTFLSVASACACAPLNPAYRTAEFEFYFDDLRPKAVIVPYDSESPAIAVAESRGIHVLRLEPLIGEPAGCFRLIGAELCASTPDFAGPDDIALILHTSGTTSRPKMVPLSHRNLVCSAANIRAALQLTADDRCLNIMPLFHIHGLIAALVSSLASGASVVCSPGFLAPKVLDWMREFQPTWYTAVPTMHQGILDRARNATDLPRLRLIRSSSSALPPTVMEELERVFRAPVIEAYGMTEASHQMASNPLPPLARKPGSVGLPAGPEVAVVDSKGEPLLPFERGEIVIRGANVTGGYLENPAANQNAFTAQGWFRTGDEGYLDDEGYLFLSGRLKEMINRGGEKIAPREIDEVLLRHPGITEALAFAMPDPRLGEDVAAAVVLRAGAAVSEVEIREFAAKQLADFKVPRKVLVLDAIPRGATGKPQRIGLAEKLGLVIPCEPTPAKPPSIASPATPTEQLVAEIWRDVLETPEVGVHDDFFEIGGDSMLAAQVQSRILASTGRELPILTMFDSPTVRAVAEWIDHAPDAPKPATIPHVDRNRDLPLSYAQERLWFLEQFEQDRTFLLRPSLYRLKGHLDVRALARSLNNIVERHEAMRTSFQSRDGIPVQVPGPARGVDIQLCSEEELSDAARQPMDLKKGELMRAHLVQTAADEHLLLIVMHHIAMDGWAARLLLRELAAEYEGEPIHLPIQYGDFAVWQRETLQGTELDKLLTYWKQRLAGAPALLQLPTDRQRPAEDRHEGARETLLLPSTLRAGLESLGHQERSTLFMILLAGFQTLLHRYSGSEDIVVGSPIANRTRPETEALIGLFMNMLAMRTDFSGDPDFRALLGRVRAAALGAYAHQDMPFEKLVEALNPERNTSYSPLFQVMFQLRNLPEPPHRMGEIAVEEVDIHLGAAEYDLALDVIEKPEGVLCRLEYKTSLFDGETACRMLRHYRQLLESAAQNPDRPVSTLPIVTAAERKQLVVDWNNTRAEYPRVSIHELVEGQAALNPTTVAVCFEEASLTYADLNRRAEELSVKLRAAGVQSGDAVAVVLNRSLDLIVGLLGVLKTGAAYVPLDPEFPEARREFVIADSGAAAVVDESGVRPCRRTTPPASAPFSPESTAYIIYTSGSTGKPKGVRIPHRAVINVLKAFQRMLQFTADDVMFALTTVTFDISVLEIFLPLISGARLVVGSRRLAMDTRALGDALACSGATVFQATPTMWRMLLDAYVPTPIVRTALCGGEPLDRDLANRLAAACDTVWNVYGPTETTIWSTACRVQPDSGPVLIGRPIANTTIYILDRHGEPLPAGIPGLLYIGGDGLALGYQNLPDLTRDRFRVINGEMLYSTGDLARYHATGEIEFLGRVDHQVKVRGFRIELGEIESVLQEHLDVATAAVITRQEAGENRIIAFVASAQKADLAGFLKQKLPAYMIPSRFEFVESLPLLPSGKVDRKSLVEHQTTDRAASPKSVPPRDEDEERLVRIWESVLNVHPIGVTDDFFDLGGNSLLAPRLVFRMEREFGARVALALLFQVSTIEGWARILREKNTSARVLYLKSEGAKPPLLWVHAEPRFRQLANLLGPDQPVLGLQLPKDHSLPIPYRMEDIAAYHVETIMNLQPEGPYSLIGFCSAGIVAYEIAQQLTAKGKQVSLVMLLDSGNENGLTHRSIGERMHLLSRTSWADRRRMGAELMAMRFRFLKRRIWLTVRKAGMHSLEEVTRSWAQGAAPDEFLPAAMAAKRYRPQPYPGRVVLFRRGDGLPLGGWKDPKRGWGSVAKAGLEACDVPGGHLTMFHEPNVRALADSLRAALA
jgi:amino acid adenylation domain-containing protein